MKKLNSNIIVICLLFSLTLIGCDKGFLDKKPSSDIIQPTTLDEFQLLLQNTSVNNHTSALPLLASDDYEYISYEIWQGARNATERNSYIWAKDIFEGQINGGDWDQSYESIFYSNNILDGLENVSINDQNRSKLNFIKGWALFNRAFAYYDLIRNFSPAYSAQTASTDLGVPLKLNPSVDETLPRASQRDVYDRIIMDLTESITLLDGKLPSSRNQPSKIAGHALFARIYLSMRDYLNAEKHADSAMALYDDLIDYNTVSTTSNTPFSITNLELLYTASSISYPSIATTTSNALVNIPNSIIQLYDATDLRLPLYFAKRADGTFIRKRGYVGSGAYPFTGLATDEVYLIKSECAARRNDVSTSLAYLNDLLINRYKSGSFMPVSISDPQELLAKVILERRKELIWRCLRWDDIKRLNKEGAGITLTRELNGQIYTLSPNDPRYVFPIPDDEINLSRIEQNNR